METLDLNQAAEYLKIHPHTLEKKARAGEIDGVKPGKCWVFKKIWLDGYLDALLASKGGKCRSIGVAESGIANGKSADKELEKRLARPTAKPRRNTTTGAVLRFGGKTNLGMRG